MLLRNLTGFTEVIQTVESALLAYDRHSMSTKGLFTSLHTISFPQQNNPPWFLLQWAYPLLSRTMSFTYSNFYFFYFIWPQDTHSNTQIESQAILLPSDCSKFSKQNFSPFPLQHTHLKDINSISTHNNYPC